MFGVDALNKYFVYFGFPCCVWRGCFDGLYVKCWGDQVRGSRVFMGRGLSNDLSHFDHHRLTCMLKSV